MKYNTLSKNIRKYENCSFTKRLAALCLSFNLNNNNDEMKLTQKENFFP